MSASWDGLNPPYSTVVVDPPWYYATTDVPDPEGGWVKQRPIAYSTMAVAEIAALPMAELGSDVRAFLWTTNRYLRDAWAVMEAWGFTPTDRLLVWCKGPRGTVNVTTEFIIMGKRGHPPRLPWHGTTWFDWERGHHSQKPAAFYDLVEKWCPGPYAELFARQPRLGWDHWGFGHEIEEAS